MRALFTLLSVSFVAVACGGAVAPIGGDGSSGSSNGGVGTGTSSSSSSSSSSSTSGEPTKPPPPGCDAPPSPGASDACMPIAGTYRAHYVMDPSSSPSCSNLPDEDTTVDPKDVNAPPSEGCTNTEDSSACVFTVHCDQNQSGTRSVIDETVTTCGGISGSIQIDSSGGFSQHCVYTFVLTKK